MSGILPSDTATSPSTILSSPCCIFEPSRERIIRLRFASISTEKSVFPATSDGSKCMTATNSTGESALMSLMSL